MYLCDTLYNPVSDAPPDLLVFLQSLQDQATGLYELPVHPLLVHRVVDSLQNVCNPILLHVSPQQKHTSTQHLVQFFMMHLVLEEVLAEDGQVQGVQVVLLQNHLLGYQGVMFFLVAAVDHVVLVEHFENGRQFLNAVGGVLLFEVGEDKLVEGGAFLVILVESPVDSVEFLVAEKGETRDSVVFAESEELLGEVLGLAVRQHHLGQTLRVLLLGHL